MAIVRLGSVATAAPTRCAACRRALIVRQHHTRGVANAAAAGSGTPADASGRARTTRTSREQPSPITIRTQPGVFAEKKLPRHYFRPSDRRAVEESAGSSGKPPDENRANLGRTLRILQDRLPTLLQSPLQQDILAPNISLHLFPSTHPHLPTVSGRVAYTAALWTSPIAWNRVPVIGNVKLSILSARVTREPVPGEAPMRTGSVAEKLVVRWCTCGGPDTDGHLHQHFEPGSEAGADGRKRGKHFAGLFIFQFDEQGRILSHTIETVEGGGDWERGVGAKVVGLTDWLLGGLGRGEPSPAFERVDGRHDDSNKKTRE